MYEQFRTQRTLRSGNKTLFAKHEQTAVHQRHLTPSSISSPDKDNPQDAEFWLTK